MRWNKGLFFIFIILFICSQALSVDKTTALRIANLIEKHTQDLVNIRRFIHMNPELGGQEFETSRLISSKLLSLEMEVEPGTAKTGVVGLLRGNNDGATIGVRADMDAFPIEEQTGLPFKSLNKGIMHACGHDIHISIVLGTAMVLSEMKDRVQGNIKFIFQPGEEGGAALMIEEGVLKNPSVRALIGLHVWPEEETGKVLFSPEAVFAGSDSFEIIIKGKSSPGSKPHQGIDAVHIASQVVVSIQSIINRTLDPVHPALVTIGKISGGTQPNIIAEEARLEGTVKTLDSKTQEKIKQLVEKIVISNTQPFGASYSYSYKKGIPPLYNHPDLASILRPSLVNAVGESNALSLSPQMMTEDFSEYTEKIPGFYFMLGVKPPWENSIPPLHSSKFNPDENCIPIGIKILCHLVLDCLDYQKQFENNNS
ncbi:MAG: M20 metallopeptidase family protein [Acidobacteriota bacterium]